MEHKAKARAVRPHVKPSFHWHLRAGLAACGLVVAGSAGAQDIAGAASLFNRGLADMEAGRYETGCKAIAESQRLDPRPGTLFTLATCEARWGRVATAVARYGDYLALYERLPDDRRAAQGERPKVATAEREKLAPHVPQLTLSVAKTAPPGTVVRRNGEVVAELSLGVALPVDPGEHTLSIQTPGGSIQEQRLTIGKGEKKLVTLEVKAAPTPAPGPSPVPKGSAPRRSYAGPIIAFGAGAAGLGVGIGLGVMVLGKRAELDDACPDQDCDASQRGRLDEAKTLSHVSTAGFVVAGIGAATGTLLLLLPVRKEDKPRAVSVRLGATYLGLQGSF